MGRKKIFWSILFCLIYFNSPLVFGQGDISIISKQSTKDTVFTGEGFTYVVTFQCNGDSCKEIIFTDTLPLGLEYTGENGSGAYNFAGSSTVLFYEPGDTFNFTAPGILTLNLGDLAAGEATTINLNVRFQQHGMIPDGFNVANTAYIQSIGDPNPSNNFMTADAVTARAESNWQVRKIAEPGDLNSPTGTVTADTTALDNLTFYEFAFNRTGMGGFGLNTNYFTQPALGHLALDTPIVVDYLSPGITCSDIDLSYTTPGFVCVAPGNTANVAGYSFTNTTSRFALVWNFSDPALSFSKRTPYYPGEPLGFNNNTFSCNLIIPGFGSAPNCLGLGINWTFVHKFTVALTYSSANGFMPGDSVKNTAVLLGANPVNDLNSTWSSVSHQDSAAVCHVVAPIPGSAAVQKKIRHVFPPTNQIYVGANARSDVEFFNTGVVPLSNAKAIDRFPSELDISTVALNGSITGPVTINLFYSDGSVESLPNNFSFTILSDGAQFTVPPGEFIDSVEFVYNDLMLPGETMIMTTFGKVLLNRWTADRNTAGVMNPSDPGGQPNNSLVEEGQLITNCGFIETTESGRDTAYMSIVVGPTTALLGIRKTVSPVATSLPGDTLQFRLEIDKYTGGQEVGSMVWHDTLPPDVSFTGSYALIGECATMGTTSLSLNVIPNVNGSNRELLEFTFDTLPFSIGTPATDIECGVGFEVELGSTVPAGLSFNQAFIVDYEGPPGGLYNGFNGILILDENGNIGINNGVPGNRAQVSFLLASLPAGASAKYAQGSILPFEAGPGEITVTAAGQLVNYRLQWKNTGNAPVSFLKIIDLLPALGDVGPLSLLPRNSDFSTSFEGNVMVSSNIPISSTILVNSSNNPCREDYVPDEPGPWPPGCIASPFVPLGSIPNSAVQALAIEFLDTFQIGDSVLVSFDVQYPASNPAGEAYNNFSWVANDAINPAIEIGAESPLVGLAGVGAILGNRVFCDLDGSGNYDMNLDDIPMDGVTLYLYEASTNQLVDSTTLFGGMYEFDTIIPDDYIVVIPADEFQVGGLLEGYSVSPAPAGMPNADLDDDVDHNALSGTGIFTGAIVTAPITISGNEVNNTLDFALNCFSCDIQISAGNPITACSANPVDLTALGAFINGATTAGTWSSSGTGTFFPNDDFGTATTYTFSDQDISNGSVILTLTSEDPDGNGACEAVSASVLITILRVDCGTFPWNGGQ